MILQFRNFKFEILDTDFNNKNQHQISIEFVSEPVALIGKISNDFLVSKPENFEPYKKGEEIETKLLPSQKALNIYSFQKPV